MHAEEEKESVCLKNSERPRVKRGIMKNKKKRPRSTTSNKSNNRKLKDVQQYYGLMNQQRATCYLNSVLQVLFMTPEVNDRLKQDHRNESLDSKLMKLFEKLRKKDCGTEAITKALGIRKACGQHDAAQCLGLILQKLSPQVSGIFQGKLTYTATCTEGHITNGEPNPFWTLPLSLRDSDGKTYSVEEGFNAFFTEISYKVYCNTREKKTEAKSRCEMDQSPQILILLLKRFDFDHYTLSDVKSNCDVEVSVTLHVETKQQKKKQYKLYGMVNHRGSLRGGHYTATIKSKEDEPWFEFNDSHVHKVQGNMFENQRTYKSNTAYLLIYRAVEPQSSCDNSSEDLSERVLQTPGSGSNENEEYKDKDLEKCEVENRGRRRTGLGHCIALLRYVGSCCVPDRLQWRQIARALHSNGVSYIFLFAFFCIFCGGSLIYRFF